MCSKYFQMFWFLITTSSVIIFGCTSDDSYDNSDFVSEVNSVLIDNSTLSEIPFVIVGGSDTVGDNKVILSSNDGITWNKISLSSLTFNTEPSFNDVVYGDKFVLVGTSSWILNSNNSLSWTNLQLQSPLNVNWENITYGNSAYLASSSNNGTSQGKLMYSIDGKSWTDINTNLNTSDSIQGLTYCIDNFIFWVDTNFYVSPNGTTWNGPTSAPAGMSNAKLHCINETFIVTGKRTGSGEIFYTTSLNSLNTWTITSNLTEKIIKGIAYGNNKYIAIIVGGSGVEFRYASNLDSTNWTKINTDMTSPNDIIYRNGKFIVIGNNGEITYSTDGLNWLNANSGTTSTLNSIY